MHEENVALSKAITDEGGRALVGEFQRIDDAINEKMVDVLCALSVVEVAREIQAGERRETAIVVMSRDIDLLPAVEAARAMSVPTYVASTVAEDERPKQRLVLAPHVLSQAFNRDISEWVRSRAVAGQKAVELLRDREPRCWDVVSEARLSALGPAWFLRCATSGARALLPVKDCIEDGLGPGDECLAFTCELVGPQDRADPVMRVSQVVEEGYEPPLHEAEVVARSSASRVVVKLGSGNQVHVAAPPDLARPGDTVVLQARTSTSKQEARWHVVGPVMGQARGVPSAGAPELARVEAAIGQGRALARFVDRPHERALFRSLRAAPQPEVGELFAVLRGEQTRPAQWNAAALSTALPQSS